MTRKLQKFSTSGNDGSASWSSRDHDLWSSLDHDLLFLVMTQMGVFDFIAFSGVCKSWRSLAVSNWNKFMVSKQPMYLSISTRLTGKDCYFEDYTRRKSKTIIPHSNGRRCVGITCGYLIFFGEKTNDFWLVNPFTRKELHFPGFPFANTTILCDLKGILVFSPSMAGWVFVVLSNPHKICFSSSGKHARWRCISSKLPIYDLHVFKGRIYTIINDLLCELRLNPEPTFTLQRMKNFLWPKFRKWEFVSSLENLYVRDITSEPFKLVEVEFDEMKWTDSKGTIGEYAVFVSDFKCNAAINPDTWTHPWTRFEQFNCLQSKERSGILPSKMWYFPHDCLIDNDSENGALLNILEE